MKRDAVEARPLRSELDPIRSFQHNYAKYYVEVGNSRLGSAPVRKTP